MESKEKIFLTVVLLYIVYMVFPIIRDISHIPIEYPSVIVVVMCVVLYSQLFVSRIFKWFLVYFLVLFSFYLIGKPIAVGIGLVEDGKKILIEGAYILPSLSIYLILTHLQNAKIYKIICYFSIVAIILSFVYIAPLLQSSKSYLRDSLSFSLEGIKVIGLPTYALMHAYVFVFPALCYAFSSTNKILKLFFAFTCLAFIYIIVSTYVTTSLFVLLGIIIITIVTREGLTQNNAFWAVFIIALLFCLYVSGAFIAIIDFVLPAFSDTAVAPKLTDIRMSLMEGKLTGGSIEGRHNYHIDSWAAFMSNPFWGTHTVGGHSSFLDRLGGMGLMGFVPYLMMFVIFIKNTMLCMVTPKSRFYFKLTSVVVFSFLYMKALFDAEGWLFFTVIAPSIIYAFQDRELAAD